MDPGIGEIELVWACSPSEAYIGLIAGNICPVYSGSEVPSRTVTADERVGAARAADCSGLTSLYYPPDVVLEKCRSRSVMKTCH